MDTLSPLAAFLFRKLDSLTRFEEIKGNEVYSNQELMEAHKELIGKLPAGKQRSRALKLGWRWNGEKVVYFMWKGWVE